MNLYKIKKSNIDNKGLIATKNIKKGTRIIEYKENPKFDNSKRIYIFEINNKYDLDGDFDFNHARLINHSCNPNCEVVGKGLKLWIESIKNIQKGEELSYDYGFSFDKNYRDFPCRCNSSNCCRYIVREGSRWRIKKNLTLSK